MWVGCGFGDNGWELRSGKMRTKKRERLGRLVIEAVVDIR